VSFANPIGAFVVQLTDWLVKPLRRVIPAAFGFDSASLFAAYLLQVLLLLAVFALRGGLAIVAPEQLILPLLGQALLATVRASVYLLIGALILQAVLSWVNPYSPLAGPAAQLTRPLLNPIRRILPPIAGIDLSPLVAILLAQLVLIFL
jgi:YggT family protein